MAASKSFCWLPWGDSSMFFSARTTFSMWMLSCWAARRCATGPATSWSVSRLAPARLVIPKTVAMISRPITAAKARASLSLMVARMEGSEARVRMD